MARKGTLPGPGPLDTYRRPGDFLDCYSVPSPLPARDAARIIARFPGWARHLLALRNALMRRLYLCAVMPFHILILRNAMTRLERAPKGPMTC